MTRVAVPAFAAMLAFAAAPLIVPPDSAMAGDAAEIAVLGFTEGGSIFAFEEYGIQDGSGFPYANRFYIDTATDGFVSGTPIRIRIDDETASLSEARRQAREKGQSIVGDDELDANRGQLVGFSPPTEMSADPLMTRVNPRPVFPAIDAPLEFRIETIDAEVKGCEGIEDVKGFRLTRITEGAQQILHADRSVPESRGCPTGYAIGGVQTLFPEGGKPVFAVLVSVRRFGFEGPDHRWLAVTGRF